VLGVLRAVVDDEQRQQRLWLDALRRPNEATDLSTQQPRRDRERLDRPGRCLVVVDPDRPLVPLELEHGALAERRARTERVLGVDEDFGAAVGALDLELVLEPHDPVGPRDAKLPGPCPAALAELRGR
jgi:hypothetical protein